MKNFSFSTLYKAAGLVFLLAAVFSQLAEHIGQPAAIALFLSANFAAHQFLGGFSGALGASGRLTMLDIAKLNGTDATVGLIEENLKYAPEMNVFPFRTIRGTSYKTGVRTGLPPTGFRSANEGQTPGKSEFTQRLIECFIFGGPLEVDKRVAEADERGVAHVQAIEASGVMKSAMINLGKQVWYGVTNDAKGFPGLKAFLPFGGTTAAGDALTINATGTSANTASSVYAVKFGEQDLTLIGGQNKAWDLSDWSEQQIVAANGGKMHAYVAELGGWIGLQAGHENVARRIANLTAENGKGLTDLLLADLLATFPVGYRPDAIFMSRRSCTQLQKSRTVVLNGNGTTRPNQPTLAPRPTSYEEIPIIETDSILNTDAIES